MKAVCSSEKLIAYLAVSPHNITTKKRNAELITAVRKLNLKWIRNMLNIRKPQGREPGRQRNRWNIATPRLHDASRLARVTCRGCARRRFMKVKLFYSHETSARASPALDSRDLTCIVQTRLKGIVNVDVYWVQVAPMKTAMKVRVQKRKESGNFRIRQGTVIFIFSKIILFYLKFSSNRFSQAENIHKISKNSCYNTCFSKQLSIK
jgi:hypothetical protein